MVEMMVLASRPGGLLKRNFVTTGPIIITPAKDKNDICQPSSVKKAGFISNVIKIATRIILIGENFRPQYQARSDKIEIMPALRIEGAQSSIATNSVIKIIENTTVVLREIF